MNDLQMPVLALFYCQNVPESSERERQGLEEKYGKSLRLFPIPCSGRLESIHLLKTLEEFADAAYVITCPEGACGYFEGNRRTKKRVYRTMAIISGIGLEEERLGVIMGSYPDRKTLSQLAEELMDRVQRLGPSPVHDKHNSCLNEK